MFRFIFFLTFQPRTAAPSSHMTAAIWVVPTRVGHNNEHNELLTGRPLFSTGPSSAVLLSLVLFLFFVLVVQNCHNTFFSPVDSSDAMASGDCVDA